ncbi:putative Ubiquitin-protein ligase E3A [Paratrimastix pyriformis]|uniref:HECT-type E3 ubiquitin transferase n=1 Tax=Paratrimastix pyriformis TaxID=342808 RepID=A0ABQ8ULL0_9EUKA|nr:putative Ubiquitin-protein ligase E3A [Paratrimastix pyriformis]
MELIEFCRDAEDWATVERAIASFFSDIDKLSRCLQDPQPESGAATSSALPALTPAPTTTPALATTTPSTPGPTSTAVASPVPPAAPRDVRPPAPALIRRAYQLIYGLRNDSVERALLEALRQASGMFLTATAQSLLPTSPLLRCIPIFLMNGRLSEPNNHPLLVQICRCVTALPPVCLLTLQRWLATSAPLAAPPGCPNQAPLHTSPPAGAGAGAGVHSPCHSTTASAHRSLSPLALGTAMHCVCGPRYGAPDMGVMVIPLPISPPHSTMHSSDLRGHPGDGPLPAHARDADELQAVVMVLKLLDEANSDNLENPLAYTEFYNDAVNENTNWADDYSRLLHKRFAFSGFPFLLDTQAKARILQFEAQDQQNRAYQNAIFQQLLRGPETPYCVFRVRRDHLIEDALTQVMHHARDLKKPLKVVFEEGILPAGRPEIFDPKYGMFTAEETRLFWFNPGLTFPPSTHIAWALAWGWAGMFTAEETRLFWFNPDTLELDGEYKLIGAILGLAIYNGVILDVHLPLVAYKKLLGRPVTARDVEGLSPMLARSLQQVLTLPDASVLEQTFSVEREVFGVVRTHELKPGGAEILVTNDNRAEYVQLYVKHLLEDSVSRQFAAFKAGFDLVVGHLIKIFRAEEMELLICGSRKLDFAALEKNAQYDGGYGPADPVIRNFWSVVHEMAPDQQKRLLCFVTGSDRAPIGGLGTLPFIIARTGDTDKLPTSHTCFNVLLLPAYPDREKLRQSLLVAISNAEGFGL